ncbi:DUF2818 family protein [Castellaniella sp.]|uniref:DUF2818 family protein n=1 Tax=Castellaniella sp. TaxID=1955812 RepID=UPI00356142AB
MGLFVLKLLFSGVLVAVLLWLPGAFGNQPVAPALPATAAAQDTPARRVPRRPDPAAAKPFVDRFLEVLVGYVLVGTLGFAFELNLGNAFAQGWEFYAVTLALFLVLGYPGFVWRYMLKRRR